MFSHSQCLVFTSNLNNESCLQTSSRYLFMACCLCCCSFLFDVFVFVFVFKLSLELCRCSSDLFLSSRPRTEMATAYQVYYWVWLLLLLLLFLTFSVLVANPKKTLYTVANPARGLLNREKRTKEKVWQHTPPHPPHCSFGENK